MYTNSSSTANYDLSRNAKRELYIWECAGDILPIQKYFILYEFRRLLMQVKW